MAKAAAPLATAMALASAAPVRVEAEFAVGEYEIVILSADDSTALDAWLKQNRYHIPDGAEPVLRPYVQTGAKFFVAKVNAAKVRVIARGQRYELANYPNVTIPTNIELGEAALASFGAFYVALFDKAVEKTPKAAVTEYAWSAGSRRGTRR
jgi:hypothetical protein